MPWLIVFPLLGLLLLVTIAIGALALSSKRTETLADAAAGGMLATERVRALENRRAADQRGFLLSGDEALLASYRDATAEIERELQEISHAPQEPGIRARLSRIQRLEGELRGRRDLLASRRAAGEPADDLADEWRRQVRPPAEDFQAELTALAAAQETEFQRMRQETEALDVRLFGLLLAGAAMSVAVITSVLWMLARHLRAAARDQETLRRVVAGATDLAMITVAPDGTIASWNYGAQRIKGWTAEEAVGQPFSLFFTPEDRAAGVPEAELRRAREEGHVSAEGWRQRKDGTRFWALADVTAVRDESGNLREFFKITRDITDRQALVARLQDSVRTRDELISIASHDLRMPLTAMQLQIQRLLRSARQGRADLSPENVLGKLRWLDAQVSRTAELLGYLLDLSQAAESGSVRVNATSVDMGETVDRVCERFREQFHAVGTELRLETDDLVLGHWDPVRLEQIAGNLLTNALKYGRGRPVHVRVESQDGTARLVVRDEGPGISPEALPRLFRRYQRATRDERIEGLGLGLWIVRRTAEAMGGRVWVESEPGKGATFTVELPRRAPQAFLDADTEGRPDGLPH